MGAIIDVVDDLDLAVNDLVTSLLPLSSVTQQTTKAQLNALARAVEVAPAGDDDRLQEVYTGPHFEEGVRAFLAKQKPQFDRVPE